MNRLGQIIHSLAAILLLFTVVAEGSTSDDSPDRMQLVEVSQLHMGMMVHLRVYTADEQTGQSACLAAFNRIAQLNQIFSDYETDSELSGLVRRAGDGPVRISDELYAVLDASLILARQTDGLIDPTAAPVIRLWRRARKEQALPDPEVIHEALGRIGHPLLRLDETEQTAELMRPDMGLDLGAIAKGYVGDEALAVLREHQVTRAMYEAGGDMVFGEPPPGETGWLVHFEGEQWPEQRFTRTAVSISGDSIQFILINGRRYGHIIDPRIGEPVQSLQTCLVIAPSGLTADPLATLGTIMPEVQFKAFIAEHYPDVQARVLKRTADTMSLPKE